MAKKKIVKLPKKEGAKKRPIEQYAHKGKERLNNPPVGLVTPDTDPDVKKAVPPKKTYAYDPHLDPQLVWAGKAERTSFEVPTVSLHVHERIDPRSIIEAVRKKNGSNFEQMSLFSSKEENPPLREAIDFYKHRHGWSNRLIAGDSLLVMNSLLEKEAMAGQVQMVYFDPPYGIKYSSNFQPFVNNRDVKEKDEDLTCEPETVKAFRDTWELGIHSYLSYLRDRLLLCRELLSDTGSLFLQISDENIHHAREVLDEVFGHDNECATIIWKKGTPVSKTIRNAFNYLLWYTKDLDAASRKTKKLFTERLGIEGSTEDPRKLALWGEFESGESRPLTTEEKRNIIDTSQKAKVFRVDKVIERGVDPERIFKFEFEGELHRPKPGYCWRGDPEQMERLKQCGRLLKTREGFGYKFYISDFPAVEITNLWDDTAGNIPDMSYAVQTNEKIIERAVLMSTDPGDLVFDPTCGSGTTAFVAEHWGRRWITCDTSRVATTLARQRLATGSLRYYTLAQPEEGVGSGFKYEAIPHITLKSIANAEPSSPEVLYDKPLIDETRARVAGPFTVEAVPAAVIRTIDDLIAGSGRKVESDSNVARAGESLRHSEWRSELLQAGIRGKNGQYILFSRVEALPGTRWLHAEAETKLNDKGKDSVRDSIAKFGKPQRVVISFGPEHAPLEQRQVELAWEEARSLAPKPTLLVFVAFQFDPEAAKDIDEMDPEKAGMTFLKVQMNADLLVDDLKKKRSGGDAFWLIGQPDVRLTKIKSGENKGLLQVEVLGFDYYNTKTGTIDSGGSDRIAMWMLDTDYDGRSLFPRQVFFPMAGENEGWAKLAKNLKAEIDEELIEQYRGTVSLPFEEGKHKRVAVKIVDDRGIESLRVMEILS